jgi:hypothetical protein
VWRLEGHKLAVRSLDGEHSQSITTTVELFRRSLNCEGDAICMVLDIAHLLCGRRISFSFLVVSREYGKCREAGEIVVEA